MGRILGILLVLLAVILGISFAVLNAQAVAFNYYLGAGEVPLALIVVLALAGGVILGVIGSMFKVVGLANEARRLRRDLCAVEKEAVTLRSISAEDAD
ncbi:MAG: LapA family protein [Gammaproteobacteria bacterium]